MKRESWMLGPGDDIFNPSSDDQKSKGQSNKVSTRELNPYFKDGGTGLPPGADLLTRSSFKKPTQPDDEVPISSPIEIQEKDLNKLQALKMKAEMRGDMIQAKNIEKEMEKLFKSNHLHQTDGEFKRMLFEEKQDTNQIGKFSSSSTKKRGKINLHDRYGADGGDFHEKTRKIVKDYFKIDKIQSKCPYCLESETIDMSRIIAIGNFSYLTLPLKDSLDPLHCCIIPIEHSSSTLLCGEEVWDEVRNFKKCLIRMAADLSRPILFLETVINPDQPTHCLINCVFLPRTITVDPKGFFRKALLESDEEWSQNLKLIETDSKGGLRKSIPKNFPFCYVDFRLDQGLVHIIEDTRKIKDDFLLNLTANFIGLQRHQWKGDLKINQELTNKFKQLFEPFDWTKLLHSDNK